MGWRGMGYICGDSRNQITYFPEALDDYVEANNPVRFIDAYVDSLDLGAGGFVRAVPAAEGRPCYNPRTLLKLYIYGYLYKIRSSRKLMVECGRNIELMWLLGRLKPDFRTISDFRKDNAVALKFVFREFGRLCDEMDLYSKELSVVDGSKFRAVNSKDRNLTIPKLEDKLKRIQDSVAEYLTCLDNNDGAESCDDQLTKEQLQERIDALAVRKALYEGIKKHMVESGESQLSLTDPESRLMKMSNGGFNVSYNVQTAVDADSHMVLDFEVTDQCNDTGLLYSDAKMAKEALGVDALEVVADTGYENKDQILECLQNGIFPNVAMKNGAAELTIEMDYSASEITPETEASADPEDIRKCLAAGIVPAIYDGKGLRVDVVEEEAQTPSARTFTLCEGGESVTCPEGKTLNKVARFEKKSASRFTSRSACQNCENKCTTAKFKQVDMKDGQNELHLIERSKVLKVRITIRPDKAKIKLRKCVVEHPFGTVKRALDGSYLLLKGKVKATAELSLSFLAYNMRRAINIVGVEKLIAALG